MNRNPRAATIILYDSVAAAFAWLGAYWLRFNLAVPPDFLAALCMLVWVVPLKVAAFWGFGLYRGSWRFASQPELKRISLAAGFAALLIFLALVLFRASALVPRSMLILDPLLQVLLMGGSRLAYRAWKGRWRASLFRPGAKRISTWGSEKAARTGDAPFAAFVEQNLDREAYLEAYPDVRAAGMDPVKHWLEHGMVEGRSFFPDAKVIHGDAARQVEGSQWLRFIWRAQPVAVWIYDQAENARFTQFVAQQLDREAYLEVYPDVRAAGMDPVKHWLEYGLVEGRFLYPGAIVQIGEAAARFDEAHWRRFNWRGNPVAVKTSTPIEPSLISQIKAQARHEPAVLAAGDLAIGSLRQLVGPDLLGRSGVDVRSIFAAISERPDVVMLIPFLRVDEASTFAAELIRGLRALGHDNILAIVTEGTAKAATGWESVARLAPFRQARVVFWPDICGLSPQDPHHFARWLNSMRPSRILVVNSRLGLEMVAKYGRGLSQIARIYCAYFGFGLQETGTHYAARFASRTLPFSIALVDNQDMAKALQRQWGDLPGPGIRVLPPKLDSVDEHVFSARLEARRIRANDSSRPLNWLWFSAGEAPENGAAMLAELAKMRPADQFDFFSGLEGHSNKSRFDLGNIKNRGALEDVSAADLIGYDGFLFTGLFEGILALVLRLSQQATPLILPTSGPLGATFDATSAIFVALDQDTQSAIRGFANALEKVASLTSAETLAMAKSAKEQALARHAPDVYLMHLTKIFHVPG